VWADIARALASRVGVELVLVERVLGYGYGANRPALVVAKGQAARLAYMSEFIEEIKTSGFVQQAITRSGWRGVRVAPLASPTTRK
jgi:hypothetical protein